MDQQDKCRLYILHIIYILHIHRTAQCTSSTMYIVRFYNVMYPVNRGNPLSSSILKRSRNQSSREGGASVRFSRRLNSVQIDPNISHMEKKLSMSMFLDLLATLNCVHEDILCEKFTSLSNKLFIYQAQLYNPTIAAYFCALPNQTKRHWCITEYNLFWHVR